MLCYIELSKSCYHNLTTKCFSVTASLDHSPCGQKTSPEMEVRLELKPWEVRIVAIVSGSSGAQRCFCR